MKRGIVLILAALLLLGAGCTQMPPEDLAGETTAGVIETTGSDHQSPDETQGALQDATTEQSPVIDPTQQTRPAQNGEDQNQSAMQDPDATTSMPGDTEQTQENTPSATQPSESGNATQKPENTPSVIQPETPGDPGCKHDYQQTATKAATCTAAGSKKFTCGKCGGVTYQTIPMKEHSYRAATCLSAKCCTKCAHTEGAALGHSYGKDHLCVRCGVKDPSVSPEAMPVDFVATVRSDEGVALSGITVTVVSGTGRSFSGVTDKKGVATIGLDAGSSKYSVKLSGVPEGYQVLDSYSFTSPQVTLNLKTLPVRSDPNDHSKARYQEGDKMMEFSITDVDGRTYQLSQLLRENKLIILDFWYVSCNPCKTEFPYFEAALEAYGEDIVILAVDPIYSAGDIRKLRDEMGLTFPVFQDPLGLSGGFQVESYPTTVFIDSTGTIRRIHRQAFTDQAAFLKAVAAYL